MADSNEDQDIADSAAAFLRGEAGFIQPPDDKALARTLVWARNPPFMFNTLTEAQRNLLWECAGQVADISVTVPSQAAFITKLMDEVQADNPDGYRSMLHIIFYALQVGYQLARDEAAGEVVFPK